MRFLFALGKRAVLVLQDRGIPRRAARGLYTSVIPGATAFLHVLQPTSLESLSLRPSVGGRSLPLGLPRFSAEALSQPK